MGDRISRRNLAAIAFAAACVAAPAGWIVSDRMEQDNDFCTSCHISADVPLHIDLRRAFDATEPVNLSAVHGASHVESRGTGVDAEFRCIDCHGGTSLVGRARVKALAAKDVFWYAVGSFEEPTRMHTPLWDEDCVKCHGTFDESEVGEFENPRFHQLAVHNVELGVDCVECHQMHTLGGNPTAYFLRPEWVRQRCAVCHSQFE
jgi:nitrate/TMAO reductase-like tetraheme cytochrome c subunit